MGKDRQKGLFQGPEPAEDWLARPPLNPRPRLKEAVRQAIDECRYSRPEIAERMNGALRVEGLAGRATPARIDAWAAASKPALPETWELPAFCWAAETLLPLAVLAGCLNARVISRQEGKVLEAAQTERKIKELARLLKRQVQEAERG